MDSSHRPADAPWHTDFCSEKMLAGWKTDELNTKTTDELFDAYIRLYNKCLSQRPADMHIGVHLCRGNFLGSRHFAEGAYDRIARKLFNELDVDTYYLEYDTARAGGFEPLKELPPNKNVVIGVVTTKSPELEPMEKLKERVHQAAKYIAEGRHGGSEKDALNRLGVSPQCGFATHRAGTGVGVGHKEMVAKMQLIRQLADSIWPGEP